MTDLKPFFQMDQGPLGRGLLLLQTVNVFNCADRFVAPHLILEPFLIPTLHLVFQALNVLFEFLILKGRYLDCPLHLRISQGLLRITTVP